MQEEVLALLLRERAAVDAHVVLVPHVPGGIGDALAAHLHAAIRDQPLGGTARGDARVGKVLREAHLAGKATLGGCAAPPRCHNAAALDVWVALLLIGLAVVAGGMLLRAVPSGILAFLGVLVVFGFGIPAIVIDDEKAPEASGGGGEAAAPADTAGEAGGGGGEQAAGASRPAVAAVRPPQPRASRSSPSPAAPATRSPTRAPTAAWARTSISSSPTRRGSQSAIENGGAGTGAMPAEHRHRRGSRGGRDVRLLGRRQVTGGLDP